jgi:hypothetical protein
MAPMYSGVYMEHNPLFGGSIGPGAALDRLGRGSSPFDQRGEATHGFNAFKFITSNQTVQGAEKERHNVLSKTLSFK